jgi:hypothetical protein
VRHWLLVPSERLQFPLVWPAALLVHQGLRLVRSVSDIGDGTIAAGFLLGAVLHRFPLALPGVAILQLISLWKDLPRAANHWVLAGLVDLAVLATFAVLAGRAGSVRAVTSTALVEALGPLVRPQLILLYFFAAFHKLNADFLDPDVSCLAWVSEWASTHVHPFATLPRGVIVGLAMGTIAVEAALAVLLACRRTRRAGLLFGAAFHLLTLEISFTAVALALYTFFRTADTRAARPASAALYVFPLLAGLNGLSPYLGLKTTTAFDMFSNLRVLGDASNHLLLRGHPLRVFGVLSDLVTVRASTAPYFQWRQAQGPYPYRELRDDVQRHARQSRAPIYLLFERGGRTYEVRDAGADPGLMKEESVFSRKLLPARRESWEARRECAW